MRACPYCEHEYRRKSNTCPKCGRLNMETVRSINISPSATPNRRNNIPPRQPNNSFEKGVRKDERGLPYLGSDGKAIRMKESFNKKDYDPGRESIKISAGGNS